MSYRAILKVEIHGETHYIKNVISKSILCLYMIQTFFTPKCYNKNVCLHFILHEKLRNRQRKLVSQKTFLNELSKSIFGLGLIF